MGEEFEREKNRLRQVNKALSEENNGLKASFKNKEEELKSVEKEFKKEIKKLTSGFKKEIEKLSSDTLSMTEKWMDGNKKLEEEKSLLSFNLQKIESRVKSQESEIEDLKETKKKHEQTMKSA